MWNNPRCELCCRISGTKLVCEMFEGDTRSVGTKRSSEGNARALPKPTYNQTWNLLLHGRFFFKGLNMYLACMVYRHVILYK